MKNKYRRILFDWYWIVPVIIFVGLMISLIFEGIKDSEKLWTPLIAAGLGWAYFFQKQKLEEDKYFLDSFEKFNKRFYELSDDLNEAVNKEADSSEANLLQPGIHQYFDLCIEEYQLYKRGRIPEEVWRHWAAGMWHLMQKHEAIEKYWMEMRKIGLDDGLTADYLKKYLGK